MWKSHSEGDEFTLAKVAQSDNEAGARGRQRSPVQREDDEQAATSGAGEER